MKSDAFLELLRAGLWEREASLSRYGSIDMGEVYGLAAEQTVVGLVGIGLEHVSDVRLPSSAAMPFVTYTLQAERQNLAMNAFIAGLIPGLVGAGVTPLVAKGQGIAQCYTRPLVRSCGDVDLFVSREDYPAAKAYLEGVASELEKEDVDKLHYGMKIGGFSVELHGTLRAALSSRMDGEIDAEQKAMFAAREFRPWDDGGVEVLLPGPRHDVVFVFSHILQHFFKGGIGLRQICDWCRLLWTYRSEMDAEYIASRLRSMGITTEWKAFAALAVDYLGMPAEAMPLYDPAPKWSRKAGRIMSHIFATGNFGHNRDNSYIHTRAYLVRKTISLWRRVKDYFNHAGIFPLDSVRFFLHLLPGSIRAVFHGI